jgi:predicted transcriptional regulator
MESLMQTLTFEQIDCLISLIEFHDDWDEVSELMGTDVELLHEILTEMRDAA